MFLFLFLFLSLYSQCFLRRIPSGPGPNSPSSKGRFPANRESKEDGTSNYKKITRNLYAINTHIFYLRKTIKKTESMYWKGGIRTRLRSDKNSVFASLNNSLYSCKTNCNTVETPDNSISRSENSNSSIANSN